MLYTIFVFVLLANKLAIFISLKSKNAPLGVNSGHGIQCYTGHDDLCTCIVKLKPYNNEIV